MKNQRMFIASTLALAIVVSAGWLASSSNVNAAENPTAPPASKTTESKDRIPGRGHGIGGVDQEALATLLGLTTDELRAAQKEDKTLATIAKEKGVDVQKVIDLIAASIIKGLDKQLADGTITQEQYDTRKAEAVTKATESVNNKFPARGGKGDRGDRGGRGGHGDRGGAFAFGVEPEQLTALLGLTTDELRAAQKEDKTLATLATEKGVNVQKVVDLVATSLNDRLAKELADGVITQAEYDTSKAEVATKAAGLVDGTIKPDRHGGKGGPGCDKEEEGRGGPRDPALQSPSVSPSPSADATSAT